jgi:hypothetical protein
MTQHDYAIANATFPSTRSDLNNVLQAILTLNSGASDPSTTAAGMLAYNTTSGTVKQRNAADSAWLTMWPIGKQGLVPQDGSSIFAADAGSNDTYAITLSPAPTTYATGMVVNFTANTANTGACTLNCNSLGAKALKKNKGNDLETGDILAGQCVSVMYDGTNFVVISPLCNTTPVNAQTGTTYTVLTTDRGKLVTHTNASSIAVTLPQAGSGFEAGWFYDVQNRGAGTVTITPTTSTIDGASSLAVQTNQGCRIFSDGTNYFTQRGLGSGLSAATQAEMESATSNTVATTPGRTQYHPGVAKFWVNFNGTGTIAIRTSHNVTSLTDNGTGDYTVTIATDFSSADWAYFLSQSVGTGDAVLSAIAAGSIQFITQNTAGSATDAAYVIAAGFGDQA